MVFITISVTAVVLRLIRSPTAAGQSRPPLCSPYCPQARKTNFATDPLETGAAICLKSSKRSGVSARAHASNLFIPTTRLWAALKSRLLLGQAGFGSRNLPEISPKHRITDLYAWTLPVDARRLFSQRAKIDVLATCVRRFW